MGREYYQSLPFDERRFEGPIGGLDCGAMRGIAAGEQRHRGTRDAVVFVVGVVPAAALGFDVGSHIWPSIPVCFGQWR